MIKSFTISWNHRSCGRCGGTGKYFVGANADARVCWGCRGAGILMSPVTVKNRNLFRAWCASAKPSLDEQHATLVSGRFGKSFKIKNLVKS